ncbi:SMC-Scp complex subunit ScpB [Actinoplanes sp. CA-131856]
MSSEEQSDSLAAQAAAWVPPWERAPRTPDREFQAAAEEEARAELARGNAGAESDDDPARGNAGPEFDDDPARGNARPEFDGDLARGDAGAESDGDLARSDAGAESGGELARGDAGAESDAEPALESGVGLESDEVADERGWSAAVPTSSTGDGNWAEERVAERGPVGSSVGASDNRQLPEDGDELEEAGLDSDDDFDPAFEGPNPPAEEPALGDSAEDDVPVDGGLTGDVEPVVVAPGPELELPEPIEEAAEAEFADDDGEPVDAPLPPDGDDAGDVFDAAADDDVSDDGENDLPFSEEVPASGRDYDDDDDAAALSGAKASVPEQAGRKGRNGAAAVEGSGTRTEEADVDLPGLTDDSELAAALEAIMLVVDEPVAEMQLAQILEQPTERVGVMLEDLSARYTAAGHGFDLRRVAGGWRLYTRPEYAAYVERFVLDGQSVRLTQAALETLAVVAYKQPVTRSRISAIRGVNCDGVMRTLVTRGLIEECGTESETGAHLYRTTVLFLEKLGLNSVDQLPPLAPFLPDDVEEVLDASG